MPSRDTYTDNELFGLIAKDDMIAFQQLYDRYWNKLLIRAQSKLKNEQESEDLVQEVFIILWRKRKSINLNFSFHSYIAAMLKHAIIRRLSRKNILQRLNGTEYTNAIDYSISNEAYQEFLEEEIRKNVQSLPEKCRLVFRLSREEGLTQKQIAATLKINQKTVEAHIHKALKTLRSSLQLFSVLLFF